MKRITISLMALILAVSCCLLSSCDKKPETVSIEIDGTSFAVEKESGQEFIYKLNEDSVQFDEATSSYYVNDILIIYFQQGVSSEQIQSVLDKVHGVIAGGNTKLDKYEIRVDATSLENLTKICEELEALDYVETVYTDEPILIETENVPEDPWSGKEEWDENNPDGDNWWLEAISAPSAWEYDEYYQPIKIGIVDNGFDTDHEDLKGVIKSVSSENNKEEHGTHVAGIIGAKANNTKGITGILWHCEIDTFDWDVTGMQDGRTKKYWYSAEGIVSAVEYLITEKGSKVVNLSLGFSEEERTEKSIKQSIKIASKSLDSLLSRNYDFIIVQAAGNFSGDASENGLYCSITMDNCYRGIKDQREDILNRIIVVGAVKQGWARDFVQPFFSNVGKQVSICAPGGGVYSTFPNNKYGKLSGTSMAAPVVTGVAGLVWSAEPSLNGAEVKKIICDPKNTKYIAESSVMPFSPSSDEVYPIVNAELSVRAALKPRLIKEISPEVEEFFNNYLACAYYSEYHLFPNKNATPPFYMTLFSDVAVPLYNALHESDQNNYPHEKPEDVNDLQAVLDKLYGKGVVTPTRFFGADLPIRSDGIIDYSMMGTDYFPTGGCKYYIKNIDLDGDDIKVTFQCVFIDAEYDYESFDFLPELIPGSYVVYDMMNERMIAQGRDAKWTTYEEFQEFVKQYEPDLSKASTKVLTLYKDAEGIHIRY